MAASAMRRQVDYLERTSRVISLATLMIATVATVAAPLLAISWSKLAFPGYLVEQTLVVNDMEGKSWSGQLSGIDYPQRVLRVGGLPVATSQEYTDAIAKNQIGQEVTVLTRLPTGEVHLYPAIALTSFPAVSLFRLFWVPYLVGLAYLAIGVWIYRARGMSRPGRALAFFCACAAGACVLLFDASTTHVASALWLAALAQVGGALISLSLRFPEEWQSVSRRPWLLGLPYGIGLALAVWGFLAISSPNPWAYIPNRYAIYLYIVIGVLLFLSTMFYRIRNSSSPTARRQARIVLLGSGLAFAPLTLWFVATVLGPKFFFDIALLLPVLILFPLSVAAAIFRYRLLEVDAIVNRTLFYGVVTAILAGVISVSISVSQKFFLAVTGEKSDVAAVITALIVVSAFEPIKLRVRGFVDRTFKETPDKTQELRSFGAEVCSYLEVCDADRVAQRLLDEAARGLQAQSGALSLVTNGQLQPIYTYGHWRGEAWMSVPLEWNGQWYGLLSLGPRQAPMQYTRQECDLVEHVARQVAGAVHLSRMSHAMLSEPPELVPSSTA